MKEDLISIIIPVYNVEKYLEKCLDSVINQTYKNLEIILVDDGSTDKSGDICDKYSKKDKRIKVIHQKNGGASRARNVGLKESNGKYINYLDSDDSVNNKFIEKLHDNAIKYKADISCCDFNVIYNDEPIIINQEEKIQIFSQEEALFELFYQRKIDSSLCWKLFKKEVLNNIVFPENMIFEDFAVMYKIILNSNKTIISNLILYNYFQRYNSVMNSEYSHKNMDILKIINDIEKTLIKKYPELEKAIKCRKLNACFYILRTIDKKNFKKDYDIIVKYIKENRHEVLKDKNSKFKTKVGIIISYINIDLVKTIYNIKFIKKMMYMK